MMYKLTDEQKAKVAKLYPKKQTNFEKIKAMSVEELAKWLCKHMDCWETDPTRLCPGYEFCTTHDGEENGLIAWLKSEVEE